MPKKVARFTHDLEWGYRIEPILSEVAEVLSVTAKSKDEAVAAAAGAEVVLVTNIGQRKLFTPDTIARLEGVKVIYVTGVGWDPIDPRACTKRGIILANNPEFCTHEVAEHTLTLILSLLRKVPAAHAAVRDKGWAELMELAPMNRLHGKTAGVVGLGRSGREVSRLLVALGVNVVVYDHHADAKKDVMDRIGVTPVSFDDLLARSDIVTLHVPLNDATRGMIGAQEYKKMKTSAFLVNTSRGGVVDEDALLAALGSGEIRGAALDVFAVEPLTGQEPICRLDNVVLTPHLASTSQESVSLEDLATEVKAVLAGGRPANIVNPQVLK